MPEARLTQRHFSARYRDYSRHPALLRLTLTRVCNDYPKAGHNGCLPIYHAQGSDHVHTAVLLVAFGQYEVTDAEIHAVEGCLL